LSSNTATVIAGIAGILGSVACSYIFYWLGGRSSRRQNADLVGQIEGLRRLLANFVQGISERPSKNDVRRIAELTHGDATAAATITKSLDTLTSAAAVEELVRASLGALVNEKGEVDMSRVLREASHAVGPRRMPEVVRVLSRLRAQGVVSWDGGEPDPSQEQVIRVRPVQVPGPAAPQDGALRTDADAGADGNAVR
jgi:hypothetical protein